MGGNPQASQRLPARVPRRARRDRRHPRARRQGRRRSTRAAPAPPTRPTSGSPILPGTDAAFLLAIVQRALRRGPRRPRRARRAWSNGVDDGARARARTSRPSRSRPTCRVPADDRSAASRASSRPRRRGAVYGRIGLCNQEFGTLASWLVDVVNILTGNFDRPGGLMFGNPVAWPMAWMASTTKADGVAVRPVDVARARCARGAGPGAGRRASPRRSRTPGDGQIKVLFTVAGNPVISVPDSAPPRGGAARCSSA